MHFLMFCWPCISVYLSQYLTNLMHKICFTISFISCLYMFRAHVLIIRRSNYITHPLVSNHHTWFDTRGCVMQWHEIKLIVKQILCIKLVKYWDKCICWLLLHIYICGFCFPSENDDSRFANMQVYLLSISPTFYTIDIWSNQSAIVNWNYETGSFDIMSKRR